MKGIHHLYNESSISSFSSAIFSKVTPNNYVSEGSEMFSEKISVL